MHCDLHAGTPAFMTPWLAFHNVSSLTFDANFGFKSLAFIIQRAPFGVFMTFIFIIMAYAMMKSIMAYTRRRLAELPGLNIFTLLISAVTIHHYLRLSGLILLLLSPCYPHCFFLFWVFLCVFGCFLFCFHRWLLCKSILCATFLE